jgi:hypothetical protein
MAVVRMPGIIQVELRAVMEEQHVENRVMVDTHHAPVVSDFTGLHTFFDSWVTSQYRTICCNNVTWQEMVLTDMSRGDGLQVIYPMTQVGAATAAAMPNETSLCVSLRGGLRGRSARGRWFCLPPSQADRDGPNQVSTGYAAAALSVMQAMIDGVFTATGFQTCVVSLYNEGEPRVTPVNYHYTTATLVDRILDSQRSRKPGNGS